MKTYFLVVLLSISGCAVRNNKVSVVGRSGYKVEVKADGKIVENTNLSLVNRYSLSINEFEEVCNEFPFKVEDQKTKKKDLVGLKIVSITERNKVLMGLEAEDIITAFYLKLAKTKKDFDFFCQALKKEKSSSITFLRKGVNYKNIYYFLNKE